MALLRTVEIARMTSCLRTSRSLRCVATARASSIQRIKMDARNGTQKRPRWPVIILRTQKGWACPKEIDGPRTEDYWRSHRVPMGEMHEIPEHVRILEKW